jgi:hypothetical protein
MNEFCSGVPVTSTLNSILNFISSSNMLPVAFFSLGWVFTARTTLPCVTHVGMKRRQTARPAHLCASSTTRTFHSSTPR